MKLKLILLFAILLSISINLFAQKTYTGNEAADYVQQQRKIAEHLFEKKNASHSEIIEGVNILKKALIFLDSIPIKQLAVINPYLWYRRTDANRDLAGGYALLGEKDSALVVLERMAAISTSAASFLRQEPAFNILNSEPRYLAIIKKSENENALWDNTAFVTPYKNDLTQAEKIAGLTLLWSQAKYNFVNFDKVDIDWNKSYMDYLPLVQNTRSTAEYYKILIRFYAQLKDGHTNVYAPDSLSGEFYSRPPFRTELVEGRVFVTQVFSDSLYKSGIVPGLELLKIDGEPVVAYAEKNIKPYQSSSTPQDMEIREFSYALLAGTKNKPVDLEIKDIKGKVNKRTIARTGYHDIRKLKTMEYKTIDNIGYLIINNFEDNKIVKQFDSLYTEIAKTKGLIIDVRYNGGGSGSIGFNILGRLTNKPIPISSSKYLQYTPKYDGKPLWLPNSPTQWGFNGKIFYEKPVIVLIGSRTFSAAEDFAVAFDSMHRGKMIGMPTGGSTGQPVSFSLPGGGSARVCGKKDTYPDGKEFVGVGVIPDILVKPTIADIMKGKDAAKEKAISILNK